MVKVRNRKFLFGLKYTILTLLALAGICFGQYKWEMKNPLPMDNNFTSITHVNNQFVAVGDEGTILTSPDGTVWVVQNSGTTVNLNSLAFGNNQFVAVGAKIISVTHGGSHAMVLAIFGWHHLVDKASL